MFSKPSKAIGLDVGTHSVKAVQMSRTGGRLRVDSVGYAVIDPVEVSNAPIEAQGNAVREALRRVPMSGSILVGALPGQTVAIRYPRMPELTEGEMQLAVDKEASQNLPFEPTEVHLDWAVLDRSLEGNEQVVKVILVAAKHELIEARQQIAESAGIEYNILGVDSLALADAAEGCDFLRVGETVALIDIGASSTIIHFVKDGISNFYRDINWGARELVQAVTKARRCDKRAAEKLLQQCDQPDTPAQPMPETKSGKPPEAEPTAELETGLDDSFGALEELGGSALDPLDEEFGSPQPASAPATMIGMDSDGDGDGDQSIEDVLHLPLSRLATEIRRSFDYYEQQLYEHPVDRIIVSGGVAQLPLVQQTIREEMGFERIEVADPTVSALLLGREDAIAPLREQPAQFLVAVGLAARGVMEL